MNKLQELRTKYSQKVKNLEKITKDDMNAEEIRTWDSLKGEIDNLESEIKELEKEEERKKEAEKQKENRMKYLKNATLSVIENRNTPDDGEEPEKRSNFAEPKEKYKPYFGSLADQLRSIKGFYGGNGVDERQLKMEKELRATGMNTEIGEDGAFLIEPEIGNTIFESAVQTGEILSRVSNVPTSSNEVKFPQIDEDDVSDTIYGGIKSYWASEAGTVTQTKPKFKKESIELHKLMCIAYDTEEFMNDTTFANSFYKKAFAIAIKRKIEDSIFNGTGVGMPLGILKSDNYITVAKETGQATNTFVYKNITKMFNRMPAKLRQNAVWFINPDGELYLEDMTFPVGTGGVPVFLPSGGMSVEGFSSLRGKPVIPTDLLPAFSSKGDLMFADMTDYMLLTKTGKQNPDQAKLEMSMHVQFLYGENTYRIIFRVGGRPMSIPYSIKNSSNTRGRYITIASR